jgi:hypothetical protein
MASETGWDVKENHISMMLGQEDSAWMSVGLDLSEFFKKAKNAALKQLATGGEGVDIAYDENAELPDKWHESHEPPIRFISERKDQFLRDGEQWIFGLCLTDISCGAFQDSPSRNLWSFCTIAWCLKKGSNVVTY